MHQTGAKKIILIILLAEMFIFDFIFV